LLNQIASQWLKQGVSKENLLYINFFDDRLTGLRTLGLDQVMQAYYLLYPNKKNDETIYCFFDEIQEMPDWEAFIDRLLRTENCLIYLSGSSAQMLSTEIATQMRGRALTWELFPFSFQEFTDFKQVKNELPFTSQERLLIANTFDNYWESGGFPEVADLNKALRIKIHQEYFNSILFRDLIERHDIAHPRAVLDLARKLLDNIGSMYTINSLTGFLKSLGYNVPKSAISEYINWFEDAFFLFTVRLYDASWHRSNVNPKKIYAVDHSLVRSVSSGILINSGHILENLVFTSLRRFTPEIFYYKTSSNLEVDFVIKNNERGLMLFQVCESLAHPATRQRELRAIEEAMIEQNLDTGFVISRNEEESIQLASGMIEVIPAWRFLLEMESKITQV
jgi:hypothetical protein